MKRKFTLHLDAVVAMVLLFMVSLALNIFLCGQLESLSEENQKLQWQGVTDSFNLSSQETYIKKIEKQLKQTHND